MEGLQVFGMVVLGVGLYMLPSIVGIYRRVPNLGSVKVVNFFLGWTVIGWVVALAMACRSASRYRSPAPPSTTFTR